jgi:signal transduction histidine kinase
VAAEKQSQPFLNQILYDRIVYTEYVFLAVAFLVNVTALRLSLFTPEKTVYLIIGTTCLVAMALLAPLKPLRWKPLTRALACFADCALLTLALRCGVTRLSQPLFLIVVAKAAMLLSLPMVSVLITIAWCCQFFFEYFRLRFAHESILAASISSGLLTISQLLLMIACAIAITALDRERKSRHEAELLTKEVESLAKQLERTRITREIHDVIGHSLTSLRIQLEVASRYASVDEAEARQAIDHAKELAGNALQEIRAVLHSIRGERIDLSRALAELVKETNNTKELEVQADIDADDVPPSIALEVYRIVQECLTNIMRHANADTASVRINRQDETLHVRVSDNGRGFREEDEKGIGLAGILERIRQLGGEVELTNDEGGGAVIKAAIPLNKKNGSSVSLSDEESRALDETA